MKIYARCPDIIENWYMAQNITSVLKKSILQKSVGNWYILVFFFKGNKHNLGTYK